MASRKKLCRECGEHPPLKSNYFVHNNEDDTIKVVRIELCKECFMDDGQYCEGHGPCWMTNNLAFVGDMEVDVVNGDLPTAFFCPKCVKSIIKDLGSKSRNLYTKLIKRKCSEDTLKMLHGIEDVYLPKSLSSKYPIIAACCFISDISYVDLDIIILNLIDSDITAKNSGHKEVGSSRAHTHQLFR